ncbi:uncharacterized protein LOC111319280 [Stylophora pistillata]|uniref:uncharacterized protein LOC111319280 n=1 Tax=Stylophora pistillata TaxID=50429 RepID=UPI000C04857F|nr:uncharacterized protein LOC111319280 [Stylophora pistillata]
MEVLTTSRPELFPVISRCETRCRLSSSLWKMSLICGESRIPTSISMRTNLTFNPRRICGYCNTPYSIFISYTALLNGKKIEAFSILKVVLPELSAVIKGRQETSKGELGEVVLDASQSHDPDGLAHGVLHFNWFCGQKKDDMSLKEGCSYGKMTQNGTILVVNVAGLKSKQSYYFRVLISKGNRRKIATHVLKVNPAVNFTFRCIANCGDKVVQSKPLKLNPKCEGKLCNLTRNITWFVYILHTTNHSRRWKNIPSFTRSTPRELRMFCLKAFHLWNSSDETREPRIKINATIEIQVKHDLILEGHEKEFIMNSFPMRNEVGCTVTPNDGFAVETLFNITCVGWGDEDQPLRYEYRYNTKAGIVINYPKAINNTLSTYFPGGDRAKDFELLVDVRVTDKLGNMATSQIKVKVRQ